MKIPFPNKSGRVHLLVVDDVPAMRESMGGLLRRAGYEVEVATSSGEALELTQLMRWDAVVLDVDLPDMTGMELYARILLEQQRAGLPAVFLSAWPQEMLRLSLREAHWVRLLPKPCAFTEILQALEDCLRAAGRVEAPVPEPGAIGPTPP